MCGWPWPRDGAVSLAQAVNRIHLLLASKLYAELMHDMTAADMTVDLFFTNTTVSCKFVSETEAKSVN